MILIGIQETNLDFNIINLVWNIYNTPNFGSLFCDVGATFFKKGFWRRQLWICSHLF